MGTYNLLRTIVKCPRCGETIYAPIEMSFGDTRALSEFSIGDPYKWIPLKTVAKGGRPEGGNLDGDGYAECLYCHRDFFVKVIIREDIICGVIPDSEKKPYIPDPSDE